MEAVEREVDDRMPGETAGEALEQECFQAAKPRTGSGDLAQAVAKRVSRGAPNVFEANTPIAEEIDGIACKREKAAGVEDDANEIGHVGGVDNFVGRAGADDKRRRHPMRGLAFGAIEQEVALEVEDDLHAAGGQNALAGMGRMLDAGIPERTDASIERGSRGVLEEDHLALVLLIA